ncbi:unnamed protein product, partial [Choristocarpus tenellus]
RPPTSDHFFGYAYSGFLTLQKAVDEHILSKTAGHRVYLNVSMGLFPEKAYHTDEFQDIISTTLGVFYMLAFLYPVSRMIRALVSEKEGGMKEALSLMGLPDYIYFLSWVITYMTQWLVTNILIVWVTSGSVFLYSNKWLLLVWLSSVSIAVLAFCFLLSTLFSRSKTAATLGSVLFFGAFFPYYYVGGQSVTNVSTKRWASLLVPTCFALGSDTYAAYEGGLVGIQTSNVRQSYDDNLSYLSMVSLLLLDSILYFGLSWYLDKVVPSEFGTQLPWHFPVSRLLESARERHTGSSKNIALESYREVETNGGGEEGSSDEEQFGAGEGG